MPANMQGKNCKGPEKETKQQKSKWGIYPSLSPCRYGYHVLLQRSKHERDVYWVCLGWVKHPNIILQYPNFMGCISRCTYSKLSHFLPASEYRIIADFKCFSLFLYWFSKFAPCGPYCKVFKIVNSFTNLPTFTKQGFQYRI